jgi:hypothetical protein
MTDCGWHRLGRWAQRLLWNNVDHVLPVTGVLARTAAQYGVPTSRITVISNGINPDRFGAVPETSAAKAALGLPQRLVLGFTGFIRGWNAVHHLIDFVSAHRAQLDLHILVLGDGPARASFESHAAGLGVADRLTITGIVERDDVARHVAAFDIAVLPGLPPYSSPLKLFEYLQLGRAIVAPDTENIREILTDGEDAKLLDPATAGARAAALLALCTDPKLRTRLGQAARQTITTKSLTWTHNAERSPPSPRNSYLTDKKFLVLFFKKRTEAQVPSFLQKRSKKLLSDLLRTLEGDLVVQIRTALRRIPGGAAAAALGRAACGGGRAFAGLVAAALGHAAFGAGASIQHGQFAAEVPQNHLGRLTLISVLVGVFPGLQRALDIDLAALADIFLRDLGDSLVVDHDSVPLSPFLAFAGRTIAPGLACRDRKSDNLAAALQRPGFRVAPQIADQNHLVHTTGHIAFPAVRPISTL